MNMNRYTLLPFVLMMLAVAEPTGADETAASDQRLLVSEFTFNGDDVDYFRQLVVADAEPQRSPVAALIVVGPRGTTIENTADVSYYGRFVDLGADAKTHSPRPSDLFYTIESIGAAIEITSDAIHIRGGKVKIRRRVSPK